MTEKLRHCFEEMVVYKDLKRNFFSSLSLPAFMRDWLIKKFMSDTGEFDQEEMLDFVRQNLPRKEDWTAIKSRIVTELERVRFLAKVSVDVDIKSGSVSFNLPDFGLTTKETLIPSEVWYSCANDLVKGHETWGVVELEYLEPDEDLKRKGKILMKKFTNFCPYEIETDYYKDARKEFTTKEWIDVLLGAIDYNASGYTDDEQKLTMLTRLLPFIEKRLNLVELAPKGTGKSYLFGRVSRFGWLSSGGMMTRAKLFYDVQKKEHGLIAGYDFVVFDEVQTINFHPVDEMRAALKGYMENNGVYTVGKVEGKSDAGVILCGNIPQDKMSEYESMFTELPSVFHESALIDRFHGFIQGWNVPRMNEDLKISGWALNSEYFCSILHELRDDASYRAIVDALINVPEASDTRDTEAVKRIATAYLKLLFPHVRSPRDIDPQDFKRYCLKRAMTMRHHIKLQLGILDKEYKGKNIPAFTIKDTIGGGGD
jgi:ATP-dependent Lon protease